MTKIAAATAKFTATATTLNASKAAKWVHAELQVPRTTPADAFGGAQDYVRHANANVLFEKGDNKTAEFISTGEIVRIGVHVGVPTPVNALLLRRALQAAADRLRPGSIPATELLAALA